AAFGGSEARRWTACHTVWARVGFCASCLAAASSRAGVRPRLCKIESRRAALRLVLTPVESCTRFSTAITDTNVVSEMPLDERERWQPGTTARAPATIRDRCLTTSRDFMWRQAYSTLSYASSERDRRRR